MKLLKYLLMTEVKSTYQSPITEEVEKEVEKRDWKVVEKEVDGEIVPEIVWETTTETVTETVVVGYEEKTKVEQIFSLVEIMCNDSNFESNYEIAEKEAYNSEITVEEVADPETEPTMDEILNAMLGVE